MLLGNAEEIEAFRNVVNADVISTDKGTLNLGKRIMLGRERITLDTDISPSIQTTISREYPSREDLGRLAEVASHATSETKLFDQEPLSSVYKIDLIYDQDSGTPAARYLANRVFASGLQHHAGWELKGGFCRIVFADAESQWGISLEPRFGNEETTTVFFSIARYSNLQRLPTEGEIEDSFQKVWDHAHDLLNRLDESE